MQEDKKYYVYLHKRNDNSVVFYVGHGTKYRGFEKVSRSKGWHSVVNDCGGFTCIKVMENISKTEAILLEKELILNPKDGWDLINRMIPKKTKTITLEEASSFVYYSESSPTGLRWSKNIYSGVKYTTLAAKKDAVAGTQDKRGYYKVNINGSTYQSHRIVYLLCTGNLNSNLVIDHIDGDKSNNDISNLREISQSINTRNKTKPRLSNLGLVGVKQDGNYYRAHLGVRENGSSITKSFSTDKYGKEKALYLAVKARYDYLMKQDAHLKFTDNHSCLDKLLDIIVNYTKTIPNHLIA